MWGSISALPPVRGGGGGGGGRGPRYVPGMDLNPVKRMRPSIGGGKGHPPCQGRRPQIGKGPPERTIGLPGTPRVEMGQGCGRDLYRGGLGLLRGNASERGGQGQERVLSSAGWAPYQAKGWARGGVKGGWGEGGVS